MKIWHVQFGQSERNRNRGEALAEVYREHDFSLIQGNNIPPNQKVDVLFVAGEHAGQGVRNAKVAAGIRVYFTGFRRGTGHIQFKEVKKGKYHLVITATGTWFDELRTICQHTHFVGFGFDPSIFHPIEINKTNHVVFCGNENTCGRITVLQELKKRFPDKINWTHGLDHVTMNRYLNSGFIGWNQILNWDGSKHRLMGVNYRMWEVMGSGIMLLTNWTPAVRWSFVEDKHLVCWRNMDELFSKVEHYLTHDEERERIAKAGCEYVHNNHTWVHRAQEVRRLVEAL